MGLLQIVIQLSLISLTIILHELCHFYMASLLGYSPKFGLENGFIPTVTYPNKERDFDNLIIALSAPLTLFLVGSLLPSHIPWLTLTKFVCFIHFLHILPTFEDGQVIFLSLVNIMKGLKK